MPHDERESISARSMRERVQRLRDEALMRSAQPTAPPVARPGGYSPAWFLTQVVMLAIVAGVFWIMLQDYRAHHSDYGYRPEPRTHTPYPFDQGRQ